MLDGQEQQRLERSIANTHWTPLESIGRDSEGRDLWRMRCKCGKEKQVRYRDYVRGLSLSCGCYRLALSKNCRGKNRLPVGESARNQLMLIYQRNAVKHGREFALNRDTFLGLTSSNCHYCGQSPHQILNRSKYTGKGNGAYIYNGIDRINSDIGYLPDNCVSCCRMCNYAKNDMSYPDFINWLDRLVEHRKPMGTN